MKEIIDFNFCRQNHGFGSNEEILNWFSQEFFPDLRTFSPDFSPVDYLIDNPDVRDASYNPITHYFKYGYKEKRRTKPAPTARAFKGSAAATRGMPAVDVRVAFVLHIYYPEYIPYFLSQLSRLDIPYWDVFISASADVVENHGDQVAEALGGHLRGLRAVPNRGRNFAPLVIDFAAQLADYGVICHCHSKQSLYSGRQQRDWAEYLVSAMIGAPDVIRRHINFIASGECNLISPVPFAGLAAWASHSLSNDADLSRLCGILGLDPATGFMAYPVGGMFWMSGAVYTQLAKLQLTYDDFPAEPSRPDGELHHALERLLGRIAGPRQAFYDQVMGTYWAPDAMLRSEIKRFPKLHELCETIKRYDLVTFDFFDTLAVRATGDEEWAKKRVEFVIGENYLAHRNAVEGRLREQLGATGDVSLPQIAQGLTKDGFVDAIRAVGLERALDLSTLIPRPEVVFAYEYAVDQGKSILIISDSYYDKGFVEAFLRRYGISAPANVLMSADIGLRKDRGDLWNYLAGLRGRRTAIHIGDNVHSDIQKADEHRFHWFYVPHWRHELLPVSGLSKLLRDRNLTNPAFARSTDRKPLEQSDHELPERDLDDVPRRLRKRRGSAKDQPA